VKKGKPAVRKTAIPVPAEAYLAPTKTGGLTWGPLIEGRLVRRYKRFLADVALPDGEVVVAHTANTGAMLGCCEPGRRVWMSRHDNPGRKLPYTLEMIEMPSSLVGINTGVPNRLVRTAAAAGRIPELAGGDRIRSEVRRGDSRLDLLIEQDGLPETLVEIKNCTLAVDGTAYFPDAVTQRGAKHLEELARIVGEGNRSVIFVLVHRSDAVRFHPADHIDPVWGKTLRKAMAAGVELLVYRARLDVRGVRVDKRLPLAF
jgi:sugar fermentation stimulation protein A